MSLVSAFVVAHRHKYDLVTLVYIFASRPSVTLCTSISMENFGLLLIYLVCLSVCPSIVLFESLSCRIMVPIILFGFSPSSRIALLHQFSNRVGLSYFICLCVCTFLSVPVSPLLVQSLSLVSIYSLFFLFHCFSRVFDRHQESSNTYIRAFCLFHCSTAHRSFEPEWAFFLHLVFHSLSSLGVRWNFHRFQLGIGCWWRLFSV